MRKYELTVVLPEGTSAAKKKSFEEKLTKLVTSFDGKVGQVQDWGEKELAYKIKKSKAGTFLTFPFEVTSEKAKQIDAKMKVEDEVVRYLLINLGK